MLSLLLESANKELLVALYENDKKIDEICYEAWQRQSELMIPELNKILKRNSIDPKTIDEIVVTKGPGSYTGVRIALTIAKIYALSLEIPCYAVSSLGVLKDESKTSICLINARSNRSYFGVYKTSGEVLIEDKVLPNKEVLEYIEAHKDFAVCGDVTYLGLINQDSDIAKNMMSLKNESNKVDNILTLKAVYLKD